MINDKNLPKIAFNRAVKEQRLNKLITLLSDTSLDIMYNRMVENELTPTAEEIVTDIFLKDERRLN
tara:strand:- start:995 stop:1192 length:198 start_codon:yes stop_codon:yes gene_type:complete